MSRLRGLIEQERSRRVVPQLLSVVTHVQSVAAHEERCLARRLDELADLVGPERIHNHYHRQVVIGELQLLAESI